jgi:hypothetical protein
MGLFNWFKANQPQNGATPSSNGSAEIAEDIFIEKRDPQENTTFYNNSEARGIDSIYAFLQIDFEPKGYNDALVNPDQSNKADGIRLIKTHLNIIMDKEINYYDKLIKDLECHIRSRGDAGLVDLVEELRTQKDKADTDIQKIHEIELQMRNNSGLFEKVILSYEQGFKRGLAAISKSKFQ